MTSRPLLILLCGCTLVGPVVAGSLDAPAAPSDAGSAMYTLEDLYQRLNAGTAGTPRSSVFVEPAAGPGGTMHTLTEIMAKMPALDANGATAADVLAGKTFWGLTGGAWGLQTGSMATQTVNNTTTSQNAGYYNAFNLATVDGDLTAGNIKSGTTIFGVTGAYTGSGGTTSAPFPVAKTGQTTPYGPGDDGALQKGAAWPNPRFTDNSNGTVTDNLTGLVWLKTANCLGALPWRNALSSANGLASPSCGLSDGSTAGQWRLPNIKELSSLINAGLVSPALPAGHPFAGVQSYYYWSSTTVASSPSNAWYVNLNDGTVYANDKPVFYYVWPVRGGQ
jgi:hypothetical protein